ncbi:pyridoxamine 5'-phosphate oxidase family protein [Candidatus Amarobacter glycogenicus]|uniref:pyridoxamine 5'-phosphate oxidase family protein n=1 Tax=Candidatus Amarobacter glycogenicus TaxID=3140699 RepID=UPI0031368D72|nr:pyridoxamine 5'-phosphate oxidase family protein [Dehalococcoidia bacterium]
MTSWGEVAEQAPELADACLRLLRGDGATTAYLATVRNDGGPRVHPVMPVVAAGNLYVFVVTMSWKYQDLLRDGRYALHSSPSIGDAEEFYITGPARQVAVSETREMVRAACDQQLGAHDFEALFELGVDRVLHTRWANWGTRDAWPHYLKWPGDLSG